jgi:hypothetical protein
MARSCWLLKDSNSLPHPEEGRRPVSKGFLGLSQQPASAVLAALALIAVTSPASATGTVDCEAADGAASLTLTVGSLPVLGVVHMAVTAGDRTWSTGGSGDDAISVGQAFRDGDRWLIDATDPNIEGVVAEIRLNQAIEEGDMALAGTLKIPGTGAWAVTCIGP